MSLLEREQLEIAARSAPGSPQRGPRDTTPLKQSEADFVVRALRLSESSRLLLLGERYVRVPGVVVRCGLPGARPATAGADFQDNRIFGSQRCPPFRAASFSAVAELGPSVALTAETDEESIEVLRSLARLLAPGGRYLCGSTEPWATGTQVSPDKQRIDEWRREPLGVMHHTVRLVRPDGSWRRLHERMRIRDLASAETLLGRGGFSLLNALPAYAHRHNRDAGQGQTILLCQRE
jgi:hypothetical protein